MIRKKYVFGLVLSVCLLTWTVFFLARSANVDEKALKHYNISRQSRKIKTTQIDSFQPLVLGVLFKPDDNIWYLRELVGSFHKSRHSNKPIPLMFVVGIGRVEDEVVEEIGLWQSVEFIGIETILAGHLFSSLSDEQKMEIYKVFTMNFLTRNYGHVILVDLKVALRRDVGLSILGSDLARDDQVATENLRIEGYTRLEFLKTFSKYIESIYQGKQLPYPTPQLSTNISKYHIWPSTPKALDPTSGSQNFCHLALRPETMYAPLFLKHDHDPITETSTKKKICFGIPTKNKVNVTAGESPLIKTFLRTFITSVADEEWEKFDFSLYIGYDHGDPLLDGDKTEFEDALKQVVLDRPILTKYSKLPASKWLSWIWNVLFVSAIRDNCDYFYQVNDDITMDGIGWATHFTATLDKSNGIGVAGHSDDRWKCGLLTQAFVSRRHFEIFGYFFPLEIRDWYTDNWISVIYGPLNTFCKREFRIGNGSAGQRYTQCDQPLWREAVSKGQQRIAEWKKANFFS